jgi:hypothetical protein
MAVTIDELQIEIQAKGAESASGIDKLTTSLGALKRMINKSLVGKLESLSSALDGIKAPITVNMNVKGMEQLRNAVQAATAGMPTNAANISPTVDGSAVASEMGKIKASTEQAASEFERIVTPANEVADELKNVSKNAGDAGEKLKEVGKSAKQGTSGLSKFISSLKRISMYRVVRSILSNIAKAAKEGIQNLVQYSKAIGGIDASRANETMSKFASIGMQVKNTLGSALMPVLNALMPVIQTVANWFIIAANAVNQFFAAISGASMWTKAKEYAVDYAGGLGKAAGAAGDLKNAMLGIDELNVISPNAGGGGGGAGALDYGDMFEESNISEKMQKIAEWTDKMLGKIREFLSSAQGILATSLGLFVVGTILAFSGVNIPLGIGLMAAGAVVFGTQIAAQWDTLSQSLQESIAGIMVIAGSGLFAIGAILAFSGASIPLGIGLMLAGASVLGSAVALDWDAVKNSLQGSIGGIVAIVSTSLLALGAVLAFSGAGLPLGIALMAIGAAGLATVTTLNWDTIASALKGPIGGVTAAVSAALLVIGAILVFSGVGLPLGIGLLAAGAIGLATTTALNWDLVKSKVAGVVAGIGAILSGSLIVLGVLLCLSGAGLGLGLAVLAAGLAGSYAAWTLDDNPITRFVKKMANSIIGIINTVIDAINEMFHISFNGLKLLGETIIPAFDVRLVNIPKIPTFAAGGFPVSGELFIANEAGPEMVGTMGGRTVVMNNDQIVRSVAQGVAQAVSAVIGGGSSEQAVNVNVYLDSKQITSAVEKRQKSVGANIMNGGVDYAY